MEQKKNSISELLLLGIVLLLKLADGNCPNKEICDCTRDYINCTCLQRENVIISEEQEIFSGKYLVINGCGEVVLKKASLNWLDVEIIYLSDLLKLEIEKFAFYGGSVRNFSITNIKKLKINPQAFLDVNVTNDFILNNVTLEKLETTTISGVLVTNLVIKDSDIGIMERHSLLLENSESITIENNQIKIIKMNAIAVRGFKKFLFIYNNVNSTEKESFNLDRVEKIEISYNRFQKIATEMIVAKQVNLFSFHNNYINKCEENAFWKIETAQFLFVDNQVLEAKNNSIIPNYKHYGATSKIAIIENNEIACTCSIRWLIENPVFQFIKERNLCCSPQNLKEKCLSQLKIFLDNNGNCITVGELNAEVPAVTETAQLTAISDRNSASFYVIEFFCFLCILFNSNAF